MNCQCSGGDFPDQYLWFLIKGPAPDLIQSLPADISHFNISTVADFNKILSFGNIPQGNY